MNPSSDKVLQYLAGNENIENISVEELQKLADEHPYFTIAQFLLAKKLKTGNDSRFLAQAQKTALYFSNTYWLHYQLSGEFFQQTLPKEFAEKDTEYDAPSSIANTPGNEVKEIPLDLSDKEVEAHKRHASEAAISLAAESASQQEEEMAALVPQPDAGTAIFLDHLDEVVEEIFNNNNEDILKETHTSDELENTDQVLEEMAGVTADTNEVTEAFLNETQSSAEEDAETSSLKTPIPPFTSDILNDKKNVESTEPDEHEIMFQNIKAMLDASSEEADADIKNAVIPIDPYYTIDYFASQGIKLELDQNPDDQLGQHLKKFTHWLKQMKKLGPEDATEVITRTDVEADIQKIAESSNTVREVVTEAMASVLEKQGKNSKAIELYKKLSFLIPDKSAYFADKIKHLKGI